jgi:hypothetical protein
MSKLIKAREGFYLKNKYNSILSTAEYTGKRDMVVGNSVKTVNVTAADFIEV